MIVFNLNCNNCLTEFEGWFESSKDFEKQKRKKILNCPTCNSLEINKSLMFTFSSTQSFFPCV